MKSLYALVGMKHRGTEEVVAALPQGEPLTLRREPSNPYDKFAVQVWARGQHVGYVKASQVRPVALAMDTKIGAALAAYGDASRDEIRFTATLAIDGGRWPMVEVDL